MSRTTFGALILAAGKGTRMFSPRPKVLMELLGKPMLGYLFQVLDPLFPGKVWSVIGHQADMVRSMFCERSKGWIEQTEQLGTGHALQVAWQDLADADLDYVIVANGDTPLLPAEDIIALMRAGQDSDIAFLTLTLDDPGAFGRVVRTGGEVAAIIEAKDYDPAEHGIPTGEINAGIYCIKLKSTQAFLAELGNDNKNGEYYITDLVGMAVEAGLTVKGVNCGDKPQLLGINSPAELVAMEETLRESKVLDLLSSGVLIRSKDQVRIGPDVTIEPGAEIEGPCELLGSTTIARGVLVHSHCLILDSTIGAGSRIRHFSHVENAEVGQECIVGPYARLRPGAKLLREARVGNFVEVKKATLGRGSKANHLTYLGDAEVGEGVNIGAGTITCNYDGKNKFITTIEDNAFIGSNTALVAPVTVGKNALVGAGSTVTKDVGENEMAIGRGRQQNLPKKGGS
ncbi:MAG: bifunctional UDP-N-acetylglucosamine diphosphorylase/glucosamine-1-phosphate N-acetyltransferase GlmU [Desulfovibrio sp.]|nr:MAG: bifunctional UDP-N-acetylglucosamine diphosphorylase/glucosamine-1-phosphate N-acetyltransferase GlmU [Desulfovibrio sp.]